MSYRITIQKITVTGPHWEYQRLRSPDGAGPEFGYVEKPNSKATAAEQIYEQTVEQLDLQNVIYAVNGRAVK